MPFPSFLDAKDRSIFIDGRDRFSHEFTNTNGFQIEQFFLFDFHDPIQHLYNLFLTNLPMEVRKELDPFFVVVGISELILNDGLSTGYQEISDLVYAQLISDMISPDNLDLYAEQTVKCCVDSMDLVHEKVSTLVPPNYMENHSGYQDYYWHFAFRFSPYIAQFNLLKHI